MLKHCFLKAFEAAVRYDGSGFHSTDVDTVGHFRTTVRNINKWAVT